jgi:nitrogen fixation protein
MSFKPNAPTVFINKQIVINDDVVFDNNDMGGGAVRRRNGRNNQVAITVQSDDNDLLKTVEASVMDIINAYNKS